MSCATRNHYIVESHSMKEALYISLDGDLSIRHWYERECAGTDIYSCYVKYYWADKPALHLSMLQPTDK